MRALPIEADRPAEQGVLMYEVTAKKMTGRTALACAALAMALYLAPGANAQTAKQHFGANSLIIPTSSAFQDPCGVVSAYGLIYKLLQANFKLRQSGQNPINIYWVFSPTKTSPNRCVPTSVSACPAASGSSCSTPVYTDRNWNDGCDFNVASNVTSPVALIDNSTLNGFLSAGTTCTNAGSARPGSFCTRNTTGRSCSGSSTGCNQSGLSNGADPYLTYPQFAGTLISNVTSAPAVTQVQYSGGSFVIDSPDVPQAWSLLSGTTTVTDSASPANPIDFSQFSDTTMIGQCNYQLNGSGAYPPNDVVFSNGRANEHYVFIHQALAPFDAFVGQKMNQTPAKIALLQSAGGDKRFSGVKGDMLPTYLDSAGLDFPNASGCPVGGYNLSHPATKSANCFAGNGSGQIFDSFDVEDLQDQSLIAATAPDPVTLAPRPVYGNLWVPHWEGNTFNDFNTGQTCGVTCVNNARSNIYTYANSGNVGLLAECASIGVFEGTPGGGFVYPQRLLPDGGPGDPGGGYPQFVTPGTNLDGGSAPGFPNERLLTCATQLADGGGGCVSSGAVGPNPVAQIRGVTHDVNTNSVINSRMMRNCTDPDLVDGTACVFFSASGDSYSQIGDYRWYEQSGLVSNYVPAPGNTYKLGVRPLAFTIASVSDGGTNLSAKNALSQRMADNFTYFNLYGAQSNSQIVYLGGHSYGTDVAGTRVVLNTMLALGIVPLHNEVGLASATAYNGNAFVPTYEAILSDAGSTAAPQAWYKYAESTGDEFVFPYHVGHLRAHPFSTDAGSTLSAGALSGFNTGTTSLGGSFDDAANPAVLPSNVNRNIFTYLGGSTATSAGAPNGVIQSGWTAVDIDYDSVDTGRSCLDKLRVGRVDTSLKPTFRGINYPGLIPFTGGDGVCDLQEALELTAPLNFGTDHGDQEGLPGPGTGTPAVGAIPNAFKADVNNAKYFVQLVRGFCFATDLSGNPIKHPTSGMCDGRLLGAADPQRSAAALGGFVHSQAAVIPASVFVNDLPAGKHRPTVAYVGSIDGMLHAFYVPSDGNDNGYTGAAGPSGTGLTARNPDASATFTGHTTYGTFSNSTTPLTELWAFIPPGQLPLLQANAAEVDSSPAVIDAFGDFDGSGIRSWHTVLVASAGGNNRELFALDISNPLKPTLLWDIQSSFDGSAMPFAPSFLADDDIGLSLGGQAQAFAWQNSCHAGSTGCTVSNFQLPPAGTPTTNGIYNYVHLGASQTVSMAALRRNNQPVFAAFVGTNEPQDQPDSGAGMYVFAIDVVTGQKIWEFNNAYNLSDDPAPQRAGAIGNDAPAGVTLLSKAGNSFIDTVYVGDAEGALWELDAADGTNNTSYGVALGSTCSGTGCNFAFSQAYGTGTRGPQPISTLSTIFVVPQSYPATGGLARYRGQALLAYGTAGTDTVAGLEPAPTVSGPPPVVTNACPTGCISGAIHLLPVGPNGRYSASRVLGPPSLVSTVQTNGVGIEVNTVDSGGTVTPLYPVSLTNGERFYGSIVAAGDQLIFSAARGTVTNLDSRFGPASGLGGNTYGINTETGTTTNAYYSSTTFGGSQSTPLVDAATGNILVVTNQGLVFLTPPAAMGIPPAGQTLNGSGGNTGSSGISGGGNGSSAANLMSWFFRRRGLEY